MSPSRCVKARKSPRLSQTPVAAMASTTPPPPDAAVVVCRGALLVIGTYHSVMAGLVYRRNKFGMLFSVKHHEGCVSSVAVGDKYMASAGTDERVFLFTNKQQRSLTATERQRLRAAGETIGVRLADLGHVAPPSEVRCLLFVANSQHLLCGCADGQLVMYRTRDWTVSRSLPLHEKSVTSVAAHPGSDGTLAVTIGADRYVAVVDLARGRMLSKWRYNTSLVEIPSARQGEAAEAREGEGGKDGQPCVKRAKLERRDCPHTVKFSPSGKYFTILSSHAFAVHETATMNVVARYRASSPQPCDELHAVAFLDDATMIFGNESGAMLACRGPWESGDAQPRDCSLSPIVVHVPAEFEKPVDETKKPLRHPTHHATRLKALHYVERTVFSMDAAGTVIAWFVGDAVDATLTLTFVCSANCQGRVTTMDVLLL
ncbi:hypothetical protein TraAM80_07756 [Trypanosoma rangeli]|uniref:Uncharacterized protein n=1 Tax=Trypanosoma rangeli TaxID=5698 RepID=A0A3R7KS12_TRYRA|nr:uncharacterized protein TraAM80_07756 [Trypanosoma rangeli]RNF00200.1 hypothetical protein TraAM80_07756 [Trypanosoma rangeli]|eukprot:RNF00200.1 hypothetical protein TraAM80_07756 [Trypanosoma rangeli]